MPDPAQPLRAAVTAAILDGAHATDRATRRQAYDGALPPGPLADYVDTIRRHAHEVDDELVAAARKAGLDDDGLFELAVAAAVGQASRQLDGALAALDAALAGEGA